VIFDTQKATLITGPNVEQVLTSRADMDLETAITQGLTDYLLSLDVDQGAGRRVKFSKVFAEYPDTENISSFPSAYMKMPDLTYDASSFTPSDFTALTDCPEDSILWVTKPSEGVGSVELEVWVNDREMRRALTKTLEDAFNPNTYRYGFSLSVPYYHGVFVSYSLQKKRKQDTEMDVLKKYRKVFFTLQVTAPQVRLFRIPKAKPQFNAAVE
jgi:hypothetical protein